jgi:hypothetical protein
MTATRPGIGVRYVDHLYATGIEAEAAWRPGVTARARIDRLTRGPRRTTTGADKPATTTPLRNVTC